MLSMFAFITFSQLNQSNASSPMSSSLSSSSSSSSSLHHPILRSIQSLNVAKHQFIEEDNVDHDHNHNNNHNHDISSSSAPDQTHIIQCKQLLKEYKLDNEQDLTKKWLALSKKQQQCIQNIYSSNSPNTHTRDRTMHSDHAIHHILFSIFLCYCYCYCWCFFLLVWVTYHCNHHLSLSYHIPIELTHVSTRQFHQTHVIQCQKIKHNAGIRYADDWVNKKI
jgi:hypothetical protein